MRLLRETKTSYLKNMYLWGRWPPPEEEGAGLGEANWAVAPGCWYEPHKCSFDYYTS